MSYKKEEKRFFAGLLKPGMGLSVFKRIAPVCGFAAFCLSLWVLYEWLSPRHYHELTQALSRMPLHRLLQAAMLMIAAYSVLIGYDFLALVSIRRKLALPSIASASFIANALGNNFGNALITGAAVRYWIYTSSGLSVSEISRVIVFCSIGFWLGFFFLAGSTLLFFPVALPENLHWMDKAFRPLSIVFFLLPAAYLLSSSKQSRIKVVRRAEISPLLLALAQILVASADLCLMVAIFYALLPPYADIGFMQCLTVFLVAIIAGNLSMVPGGLGVFESVVALLLKERVDAVDLASALLMFRVIYYFGPLAAAMALMAIRAKAVSFFSPALTEIKRSLVSVSPQIMAAASFIAGAILLFSGSVPAQTGRLEVVNRALSLSLIEVSHFVASLIGGALLLLARALQRRVDAAWILTVLLLMAGALLSLLKGGDYEEAMALAFTCLVLVSARKQFYRQSSLLAQPFTGVWAAGIGMVLAASAWLVYFSNRHAIYLGQSWWEFALYSEASRSLRALAGGAGLVGLFGWYRLLKPMQPAMAVSDLKAIERARPLVERSRATYANLALRGDKYLLFSEAGDAFLMFGRSGRSWIAMGDPIGSASGVRELLWEFHDLCDRFDRWCVFFEVSTTWRELYAELGLGFTLLGEEARIPLQDFRIDAPSKRRLRHACSRLRRDGYSFEIVACEKVSALLPELRAISDAWLADKASNEKGFSNASFDAHYLEQFPVAIVRNNDQIAAFANIWLGAAKEELSVDLMRHLPSAPNGTMDFLFCEIMSWGKAHGFEWFNLGMAPLSGLNRDSESTLWHHFGTLVYRHGEHFYNFDGLRHYKEKFDPVWRPLYLASPGGIALPAILVNVASLMAGSMLGIISKSRSRKEEIRS